MSKKVREMTQFDVGSGGVSSNLEGDAKRNAYAKGAAAEREKSGTTTNGRLSNTDALGEYKAPTWNGGAGAGSRSTMENLAKDIYDSSYSKFTEGEDYASLVKRYSAQGRQAMDDTVGQMAARTGGLASSWAASAGQQAYGGWMEKLEDAARSLYDSEFAEKMNKLGVAQGLYDRNYSEFKDNRDFGYGVYQDKVSNNQWQQEFDRSGEQWQYQTEQEAADDFKDSIYDAAYWGNANWAEFAEKAKKYDITEDEFNRIVKSAQGARGDDTYERDLAETEADELEAQEEQKRAQNEVMMMWAAGIEPTDDQLEAAGWADKNESGGYATYNTGETDDDGNPIMSTLNNVGQAYYKQATYKEPVDFTTTEKYKNITAHIDDLLDEGGSAAEIVSYIDKLCASNDINEDELGELDYLCRTRYDIDLVAELEKLNNKG